MATYYVAPAAGGGGSGSIGSPWTPAEAVAGAVAGDLVYFRGGTYNISSTLDFAAGSSGTARMTLAAYPGETPVINTTANVAHFAFHSYQTYRGFTCTTSSGTKTSTSMGAPTGANASYLYIVDCIIDGLQYGLNTSYGYYLSVVRSTEIKNCVSHGLNGANDQTQMAFESCNIHGNGGCGLRGVYSLNAVRGCRIWGNASHGIEYSGSSADRVLIVGNSIQGNTGSGFYVASAVGMIELINNILSGNGAYGVNMPSGADSITVRNSNNAYYNNTSGARNNLSAGTSDVTLSGDPFTNAAGGDFTLNSTSGAGASCRAAADPAYLDIGALQHQDAGGGSVTGALVIGG